MTETDRPLAVRRAVAFAEAVYSGLVAVEGVSACLAGNVEDAVDLVESGVIPVLVDPGALVIKQLHPLVVIDAIMAKRNTGTAITDAPLVIGLGPGFTAGLDVHAVIETSRGADLGRVIDSGGAALDTGIPGAVMGFTLERLLRAPVDGVVLPCRLIGQRVEKGDVVAFVETSQVRAEITGLIRGMIKAGVWVARGTKIGDIDPRDNAEYDKISDKAMAVGGAVVETVLRRCRTGLKKTRHFYYPSFDGIRLKHFTSHFNKRN